MSRPIRVFLILFNGAIAYSLLEQPQIVPRVDYSMGVVFLEKWQNNTYLGIDKIVPIDQYLEYSIKNAVVTAWQKQAQLTMQQRELAAEPSGLIPDIQLPKLPLLGEGSRIDISGSDRITLGGSQTVIKGATQTFSGQNLFPELKLEQQLAVNVNGTIGERTKITLDHNSEREEQQNKIKLQYTGTEDDIVQSVELGDTRLYIPGSIYTGDLPAHQGLFGISARGKFAGADIYAVASQEGSQSQSQNFTGRRRITVDTIWDTDFVQRRFYRLPGVDSSERLTGLRVYIDDKNSGNNQATTKAIATVFPDNPDSVVSNPSWWSYDRTGGDFDLKVPGVDYVLQPGNILEFISSIERNYVIGVVIYKENDTIGGQTLRDSLVLCLIKPEVTDSLSRAWDLQLRNCYQLRQSDVKLDTIRLYRYNPEGQHYDYENSRESPFFGKPFLQILGLDPDGDGRLDYPVFESKSGLIKFPMEHPFAYELLSVKDSIIYRVDPDFLPPGAGRKYFMVVSYYTLTETYYLGQTDILEGSERVTVNGQVKTRGTDYSIDYKTGILTFLKPLPPDADIQVNFEYQPWFSITQKSLVGTRVEGTFLQNGKIGTSFFYRNEGIREEKPQLGSEPFQRMIAEGDISYGASSDAVTAFLDRLPLLWTQTPSRFEIKTEGAISMPNPNTRGVAYLDDFEGTVISRDVSNTAMLWSFASVPVTKDTENFATAPLKWFTPREKVRKDSVFGPDIGDEGRETRDILKLVFTPDNDVSWAGIMQAPAGQLGMNFTEIENLEMILRSRKGNGNVHITVGMAIDEDAPRRSRDGTIKGYNGYLDTEDRNGNGVLDEWEDTGLDTIFGEDSLWNQGSNDEGNDDYDPLENQSGTEGNRRLDAEDIDRNGFSRYNHYFEYTISLEETKYSTPLFNGWRLYRLPLRDSTIYSKVGNPKWEDIRIVRIWLDGFSSTDTIELFSLQFLGTKWRNPRISDITPSNSAPLDTNEKIWVSQVSKKTDTSYSSPFELKRDVTGIIETEASLLLGYRNLHSNRQAWVVKTTTSGEDYRDYQDLRFFVHDDGNELECFIRLGSDSINYYEFRAPITSGRRIPGRDGKWFEFVIPLDSFPKLKVFRESLHIRPESIYSVRYQDYVFSVRGNPVLSNIIWNALGIANRQQRQVSGGIWFDDMRLTAPRKEPGYGLTAQTTVQLGDFVALGLRWNYSDPNFRRFSEARGVRTGGYSQNLGADIRLNLDRILPRQWGISIPVTYNRTRQTSLPKYSPIWPDLRLTGVQQESRSSASHSQEIVLGNFVKQKSGNKILNYTIEAMNFSWRRRWAGNHNYPYYDSSNYTGWQWGYGIRPELKIPLGGDKELYPLPREIRLGVNSGARTDIRSDTIRADTARGKGVSSNFDISFSPVEDLSIDYGWDSERDLLVSAQDTALFLRLGTEASRSENFGVAYEIEIGDVLTPSIEFDGEFNQERPKTGSRYADYRNLTNSGELTIGTAFDVAEISERLESRESKGRPAMQSQIRSPQMRGTRRGIDTSGDSIASQVITDSTSTTADSGSTTKSSVSSINIAKFLRGITKYFEPVEINYSISRSSDYLGIQQVAPWRYRLGFSDTIPLDSLTGRVNRTRDLNNSLRFSGGIGFREFSARVGYDLTRSRTRAILGAHADQNIVWPQVELNLGKVHNLFKTLATDSRLTSNYRRVSSMRAELLPVATGGETLAVFGRGETRTADFNPLISWQTTWKKRVSSNIAFNYSRSLAITYLTPSGIGRSEIDTRNQGINGSLSYAFSAPQGLKIPFLRNVRFSQDVSLTWQFRYGQTIRQQSVWNEAGEVNTVPQQRDNTASTSLGASYRFSRTIEAGLNTGYSYSKGITGISNERVDLNMWVLFKF
ncbi:MAG: cell surface protein SprA [candidate division WOR-3 bacterium]